MRRWTKRMDHRPWRHGSKSKHATKSGVAWRPNLLHYLPFLRLVLKTTFFFLTEQADENTGLSPKRYLGIFTSKSDINIVYVYSLI